MAAQDVNWALHVFNFDHLEAIRAALSDKQRLFAEGMAALAYYNDPAHAPWAVKDPRLCITLKFWMAFWKTPPAVLFVYRHPIEVRVCVRSCSFESKGSKQPQCMCHGAHDHLITNNPRMSNCQVAKSLVRRKEFGPTRGMHLWMAYNRCVTAVLTASATPVRCQKTEPPMLIPLPPPGWPSRTHGGCAV